MAKMSQPSDKVDLATLQTLPPEQQAAVLAASRAVWGLAENGEAPRRTMALIEKLAPEQQAAVLAAPGAVESLRSNRQRAALEKLQRAIPAHTRDR